MSTADDDIRVLKGAIAHVFLWHVILEQMEGKYGHQRRMRKATLLHTRHRRDHEATRAPQKQKKLVAETPAAAATCPARDRKSVV